MEEAPREVWERVSHRRAFPRNCFSGKSFRSEDFTTRSVWNRVPKTSNCSSCARPIFRDCASQHLRNPIFGRSATRVRVNSLPWPHEERQVVARTKGRSNKR